MVHEALSDHTVQGLDEEVTELSGLVIQDSDLRPPGQSLLGYDSVDRANQYLVIYDRGLGVETNLKLEN